MIIVRYYGGGSGGEFLKNCLSLSDNSVMCNHKLAELQLDNKLTYDIKINFLKYQICSTPISYWNDMGLYSDYLIGSDFNKFGNTPPEKYYKLNFYPIMDRLTNKEEKYFFIKIHHKYELDNVLQVFPNAKVIDFANENLFISIRNCNNVSSFFSFLFYIIKTDPKICPNIHEKWKDLTIYPELFKKQIISIVYPDFVKLLENKKLIELLKKEYNEVLIENVWNNIGKDKWPPYPKYIREYMKFDSKIREEIQNTLNCDCYTSLNDDKLKFNNKFNDKNNDKIIYTWDTNWYFSLEDTLKGFKELYELLGLDNYNKDSLSLLYNSWIDKMDEMKKFQLSE